MASVELWSDVMHDTQSAVARETQPIRGANPHIGLLWMLFMLSLLWMLFMVSLRASKSFSILTPAAVIVVHVRVREKALIALTLQL